MEKIKYKTYVINLRRRKDRLDKFNKECFIKDFNIFEAIDKLDIKIINNNLFLDCNSKYKNINLKNFKYLKKGEIGCFLSHVCLWEKMINLNEEYIIIFEDDPIFCKDFKNKFMNLIKDINKIESIIYFGGRFNEDFKMKTCININNNIVKYNYSKKWVGSDCDRGAYSYIINKKISKLFLDNLDKNIFSNKAVDHYMMNVLRNYKINIYHSYPLLTYSDRDSNDSDIR